LIIGQQLQTLEQKLNHAYQSINQCQQKNDIDEGFIPEFILSHLSVIWLIDLSI
jgi:hypothetical protein